VQCGIDGTSASGFGYLSGFQRFFFYDNASIAYTGCYGLGLNHGPGIITFPVVEMSSSEFPFIFKSWFRHIKAALFKEFWCECFF
jgi:hypothetical protein